MTDAHQDLAAVPTGKPRTCQTQRLGQYQCIHGDGGVDEAVRALLGIGIGVFMHLQGHYQHDDAQHGQQPGHNPWRTNQRQP